MPSNYPLPTVYRKPTKAMRRPSHIPMAATTLAALFTAGALIAQGGMAPLAKAFPRETVYYLESSVPDQFKERYSEAGLLKAGFKQEDIDLVYGNVVEQLNAVLMQPVTVAEFKEIGFGVNRAAIGFVDFKIPDMSGRNSKPSMDFGRLMFVLDHSKPQVLESILRREVEGGSPSVERAYEKEGVKLFTIDPRFGSRNNTPGIPPEAAAAIDSMLKGVIGIVANRYVIIAGREGDVLQAAEGLRGELEVEETLPGNPQFRRILEGVPKDAMMVDYLSLKEIMRLADLFDPAKKALATFEIDKLVAYGGHATMSLDGRDIWGESRIIFAGDKGPEWYEILRCPPMAAKLEHLLTQDPANKPVLTQWIGVENLAERLTKLADYGAPKIEELAKIFAKQMGGEPEPFEELPGPDDGNKGGGEEGKSGEKEAEAKAHKTREDAIKAILEIPSSEIAFVIYAPATDAKGRPSLTQAPPMAGMAWVNDGMTMDDVLARLQAVDSDSGEMTPLPAPAAGEQDPARTKLSIGATEGAATIECVALGGRTLDSPHATVLGIGNLAGHGKFIIFGNMTGIRAAASSLALATKQGTASMPNTREHVSFTLQLGEVMKYVTGALVTNQINENVPDFSGDPIAAKMMENTFGLFSDMAINLRATLEPKQLRFNWSLRGMPSLDQSAELIRFTRKFEKKESVERSLRRIRSQVIFKKLVGGGDEYPATLKELVDEESLTESDLLDPMGGKAFVYRQPKAATDSYSRHILAWQAEDQFEGLGRIVILLNGEIEVWNTKQFDTAMKLAAEGKPVPRLDPDGKEVPIRNQWQGAGNEAPNGPPGGR